MYVINKRTYIFFFKILKLFLSRKKKIEERGGSWTECKEKFINDLKAGRWKIEILDISVARKI